MHREFLIAFRPAMRAVLLLGLGCCAVPGTASDAELPAYPPPVTWHLTARVVAVGLPGVAGVRQVGRFHSGGPFTANPEFLLQTDAGRVLDPQRVLVAVASNFGAAAADDNERPGTVLSIDPRRADPLVIDPHFAVAGGQARTADGAVQVYTAQSAAFVNARHSGSARTAAFAAASGPRYLSINNAFGRPWIANAPHGRRDEGSLSVVDPDGAPLANAPSDDAGGVFVGRLTNRRQVPKRYASSLVAKAFNYRASAQLTDGSLASAVLGTAFLGASPDGTGFAVFATVTADGAIQQVHVQDGVDGLAPAGSIRPADDDGGVVGMAFQWNPQRVLYVTDAGHDQILVLGLDDDRKQFRVSATRRIASPWLSTPVDVAASVPEIGNPVFASHTTLAGSSDLFVANRGDGSLLRIAQDGTPLARATVTLPDGSVLARDRLRALAVSSDSGRIWLTVQGSVPGYPGRDGALLEVTAFDGAGAYASHATTATAAHESVDRRAVAAGQRAFAQVFTPQDGLGPLFNAQSCAACHPGPGGASTDDAHVVRRIAHMDDVTGRVSVIDHPNSPVARRHSAREVGDVGAPLARVSREANLVSLRMPMALFDVGAIDEVSDAAIEAEAVSKGDGIKGRVHYVAGATGDLRIGRFGWKADIAALDEMVADAFASELGLTSALAVRPSPTARDDGTLVRAVSAYLRSLGAPPVVPSMQASAVHGGAP